MVGFHSLPLVFWIFCVVGLQGCYEGWEDSSGYGPGEGPTDSPSSSPKINAPKLYSYSLLTTIRLAPTAMASAKCFAAQDIREFKAAEWAERTQSVGNLLGDLSEKLVIKEVNVPVSDCTALLSVLNEAIKVSPWIPETAPQSDALGRSMIHVRAVLWEGEPSSTPSSTVLREDWPVVSTLKIGGIKAKSLSYFIVSNGGSGYFSQWQQGLPKTTVLNGTPIDQVDPSDQGVTNRRNLIQKDQGTLRQWLVENSK